MAVHVYLMAVLLATSVGQADVSGRMEETLLISANPVLADVNQVTVVVATLETSRIEQGVDAADLKAQVVQKLGDTGVKVVERGTEETPRLVVHVEGLDVPGSDLYVFRVQTSLDRLVIVPGQGNRQLLTEVWRVGPVMAAVTRPATADAVRDAAIVQAGSFADACKAARRLFDAMKDGPQDRLLGRTRLDAESAQAEAVYPFVASRSSSVFHRADCRWAQNISSDNRIGYQTRDQAIADGKRPCKSCKP